MTNTFTIPYFNAITELLTRIESTQKEPMEQAAQTIAQSVTEGGVLHTFGCGHSASVALEPFHRSGCFIPVDAILDPGLMFQSGAHAGTAFERMEGYATAVMARHQFQPQDVLIAVSNSGRNPAGVDAVLYAKERGTFTIAITAASAHTASKSRHSSGKLLKDAADLTLDNCCPANETALELNGMELAPISTVAGCAVLHAVLFRAAQIMAEKGLDVPVYKSSNAGGDEHNTRLAALYASRVKHLD